MEREEVIDQLRQTGTISDEELKIHLAGDSVLRRLLGRLIRENDKAALGIFSLDLTTDAGRFAAVKQQGIQQGRAFIIDELVGLVMQQQEEKENESGSSNGDDDDDN